MQDLAINIYVCVYIHQTHTHIHMHTYTHIYLKSPWLFSKCPTPLSKFYPHPWKNHHVGCQFKIGFHENPKANSMPVTSLMLGKAPQPKATHRRKGLRFQTGVHTGWEGVAGKWQITFQSAHRRRSGQSGRGCSLPTPVFFLQQDRIP